MMACSCRQACTGDGGSQKRRSGDDARRWNTKRQTGALLGTALDKERQRRMSEADQG